MAPLRRSTNDQFLIRKTLLEPTTFNWKKTYDEIVFMKNFALQKNLERKKIKF